MITREMEHQIALFIEEHEADLSRSHEYDVSELAK